jgi:uncharacterized FAD-dependent dehydrogenase
VAHARRKYAKHFDKDLQVRFEELIAARIFDHADVETSETSAQHLGQEILKLVLKRFRPDLFDCQPDVRDMVRDLDGLIDDEPAEDSLSEMLDPIRSLLARFGNSAPE